MLKKLKAYIEFRCEDMERVADYIINNRDTHEDEWRENWTLDIIEMNYEKSYAVIQYIEFYC